MLRSDFHIHTKYLGCGNHTLEVPAILLECHRVGVRHIAITDHLNVLDQLPKHKPIREDILALRQTNVYFGVELNYQGLDRPFAFSEEIKEQHGFQFAIGGIHETYLQSYDPKKLAEIQQRHHLRTCEDPLVDVLVHPYWFWKPEFTKHGWPWLETMKIVPESYVRELGQASRDTGTAIEINAMAILECPDYSAEFKKTYEEYLAVLVEQGAIFSFASDAHDISQLAAVRSSWAVAERLGLKDDQVWRPKCKPMLGPDAGDV